MFYKYPSEVMIFLALPNKKHDQFPTALHSESGTHHKSFRTLHQRRWKAPQIKWESAHNKHLPFQKKICPRIKTFLPRVGK